MIIKEEDHLSHYGILRKSGRYPWGSGANSSTAAQRSKKFIDMLADLRSQGLSDQQIAQGFGMTTTQLRETNTIARAQDKQAKIAMAQRLKEKGLSNGKIAERMNLPGESSVRGLLADGQKDKALITETLANHLRDQVKEKGVIDVGSGNEVWLNVSKEKLGSALALLKDEGYYVGNVQVDQLFGVNKTNTKVLAPPGMEYKDIVKDKSQIKSLIGSGYSDDGGRSILGIVPPLSIDSKRVKINYDEDGGSNADGVMYLRPGKKDLSLDGARYAQVRIAVDGTHYLKGMAMYKDDLPAGVDIVFNTNKKRADIGDNKLAAMKEMKKREDGSVDMDNPFGAIVRQIGERDQNGNITRATSALNIVNEEGQWEKWTKSLSSQMLSKQSPTLAREQLDMTFERRKNELDAIMALTNPAVRKKLLEEYAAGTDSAAIHLKAAALPRQKAQVILPINSLKETEVYAPNFNNGERVVLVRFPHGGKFEIPELTVNNKNKEAREVLGGKGDPRGPAKDAIGIHSKVAGRLSGADFDGDTVLVIPNNSGKVSTAPPLEGLKNFDPQKMYPAYEGMPKMSAKTKGVEMGLVSNLITDMTIHGATDQELAAAVRHSMVVIDAEKHNLNYRQSAIDNGITNLRRKYQRSARGGASTLISNSGKNATTKIPEVKLRRQSEGEPGNKGPVDRRTGELVYKPTGAGYEKDGKFILKEIKVPKLDSANTKDAHFYNSGTLMETIYADHSNRLKDLANKARLEAVHTQPARISTSAKKVYANEVKSLDAKLSEAIRNKPLERQAQVLGNATYKQKLDANPDMDEADKKKIKAQALAEARVKMNAQKSPIKITDSEWDAIQAGAITNYKLERILENADMDRVRELATPRSMLTMTTSKMQRAESMLSSGYTQSEVAEALGVSLTTLKDNLKAGG